MGDRQEDERQAGRRETERREAGRQKDWEKGDVVSNFAEPGCCFKKMVLVESLLLIGAGAGAGKKNPESVKNRPAPQH